LQANSFKFQYIIVNFLKKKIFYFIYFEEEEKKIILKDHFFFFFFIKINGFVFDRIVNKEN
jgi:hypothetical protein